MNNKFLYVLSAAILTLLGLVYYKQVKIDQRQAAIETSVIEQKTLGDGITRSLSRYATSDDVNKMMDQNKIGLSKIQEDLRKIGTYVGAISLVSVPSNPQNSTDIASTSSKKLSPSESSPKVVSCSVHGVTQDATCIHDTYGYLSTIQNLSLSESFAGGKLVPFGQVSFTASKEKPWSIDIPQRDYKLFTVSTFDENQRMVNYNRFVINVGGQEYELPIESAEVTQVYPEGKFRWFSPRLFLGVDGGFNFEDSDLYFGPSLNLGLMNYGKFDKTPDLSVLQLGVGGDLNSKDLYFQLTPAAYNIGNHLPMVDNTYLGPSISYSPANNSSAILLSLKVGL